MRRADPHRAFLRALKARYPGLLVFASRTEPWASVTFTGARHVLICATGPDLSGVEQVEFELPGHFVADVRVQTADCKLTIEVLTIEAT